MVMRMTVVQNTIEKTEMSLTDIQKEHVHICAHANGVDPTRTLTLRNSFARDMKRRFNSLVKDINRVIIDEDGFGSQREKEAEEFRRMLGVQQQFDFPTSEAKIAAFMAWFNEQVEKGILESTTYEQVGLGLKEPWTNIYVKPAYERGIKRARSELIKAGYDVPELTTTGGISSAFDSPFHIDRVGIIYIRTFKELTGITSAMDSQISRVLAQGIAEGLGPRAVARNLTRTITGPFGDLGITDAAGRFIPAKRRATMLARTEIIRAHHVATIQEYKNWAVEGVYIKAELKTADFGVCPECLALEKKSRAKPYTLDEIEFIIPVHPHCRCVALPVDVTDKVRRRRRK